MREEVYQIRRPGHIMFGDPLCLEDKEHFKNVLVDYQPEKYFDARLILKEEPCPEDSSFTLLSMNLYLAPRKYMDTYMKNMLYKGQKTEEKGIAVDTARYHIEVDDQYLNVRTGGDGWWGNYTEFYREIDGRKISDAVIITAWVPEEEGFEGMKQMAGYLFGDLHPVKKIPEKKISGDAR